MKLIYLSTLFFIIFNITACHEQNSSAIKVGLIVPLEHAAMNEIVAGFSTTLTKLANKPVLIKVANAQGDANLQRAIIQQMRDENFTVIAPIGTDTSQMTIAMTQQPIISIASDISDSARKKYPNCHVAIVHDEISPQQLIRFIHSVYPQIKHLTLIHSANDQVFNQVKETVATAKQLGVEIHALLAATLPELSQVTQAIPQQTEAIFILKDSLIVSGISVLKKAADEKHIPLITSDQGSIESGGGFALGVHEKEIGVESAKLANAILNGKSACDLPITEMKKLTVFVNRHALQSQAQTLQPIIKAAEQYAYSVEYTDKE